MNYNNIGLLLNQYMYGSFERLQESKRTIENIKDEPAFLEYLIKKSANKTFRMLVEEFNISDAVVEERENLERNIIQNYQDYDVDVVRQSLSDLLFHDNMTNVLLTIQSIREYAECSEEFNEKYKKYSNILDIVYEFFQMNSKELSSEAILKYLSELSDINSKLKLENISILSIITELFSLAEIMCEVGFRQDVKESGDRLFDGVIPELKEDKNGNLVPLINLKNQTQNQEEFLFFARSTMIDDSLKGDDARNSYIQIQQSKGNYLSYSLFNQSKHTSFISGSSDYVVFGYFSLGGGHLLSTTTRDGQTNQFSIIKGKYNLKQNFLSSSKFMEKTKRKYNEIVCENIDLPLPDFILSSDTVPSEDIIQIASAMNIPIVFIDDRYYDIKSPEKTSNEELLYYDNAPSLMVPLAELENMEFSQN